MPTAWDLQYDCQGILQPMPTAFATIYVVQVDGTFWWHDVKAFDNIQDATDFLNLLNEPRHGEI